MPVVTDPRIDAYIGRAAPFARPILRDLRALIHRGCPEVEETMRWSMPSFSYRGVLCIMGAFQAHCILRFWHQGMKAELGHGGGEANDVMARLSRIKRRQDLPPDRTMLTYVRTAAKLNAAGALSRRPRAPRPALSVPKDLAAALAKTPPAQATFARLSPSHRREYIEWITEAKRDETRQKRLATTLAWLAEGKSRNWQYAKG